MDEVNFTCGPEDNEHSLDDSDDGGCYAQLEAIFSDFEGTDLFVGASENWHIIRTKPGMSKDQLWALVRERLLAAGAVPFGSPMPGNPEPEQPEDDTPYQGPGDGSD